nr:hypothetical protein Itr_chr14CG30320 [Ipomoea trifida]
MQYFKAKLVQQTWENRLWFKTQPSRTGNDLLQWRTPALTRQPNKLQSLISVSRFYRPTLHNIIIEFLKGRQHRNLNLGSR